MSDEVFDVLKQYVITELLQGDDKGLDGASPLLEWGVIDSLRMPQLVTYMEEQFGIVVTESQLVPANFMNLDALVRMVAKLRKAA